MDPATSTTYNVKPKRPGRKNRKKGILLHLLAASFVRKQNDVYFLLESRNRVQVEGKMLDDHHSSSLRVRERQGNKRRAQEYTDEKLIVEFDTLCLSILN